MAVNGFGNRIAVREDINGAAWHKLGGFIGEETAMGTIEKFSDGIPVFEKVPTFIPAENETYEADGDFAIVRLPTKDDPKRIKVGNCTAKYNIVQPTDIAESFDKNVSQPIETLIFLNRGEKMAVTWAMPKSEIVVGKDDVVKLFGTVLAGFDARVSVSLSMLTFRVVCENTFNAAIGVIDNKQSDGKTEGRVWMGRHNSPNILRDLSSWMKHVQSTAERETSILENLFNKMQSTPVDNKNVLKSLIEQIYPDSKKLPEYYPQDLRFEKEQVIEKEQAKIETDRMAIEGLFGGQGIAIDATAWGLFNCVSEYECHHRLSKKDKNSSIVFGGRSKTMNDAFSVISNYIK